MKQHSRNIAVESIPEPDVRTIRQKQKLSQQEFAAMLGISLGTLRNWEQGRRKPEGAARVLLQVAAKHPTVIWDTVHSGLVDEESEEA
jgi:putative transcriptional regulator